MKKLESECQVCGVLKSHWFMCELRSVYRIFPDIVDICDECGVSLNQHLNYWGKKKESDKLKVRQILMDGKLVNDRFKQLMCAGYF